MNNYRCVCLYFDYSRKLRHRPSEQTILVLSSISNLIFNSIFFSFFLCENEINMRNIVILSGSSHPTLADRICNNLGIEKGETSCKKFR